MELAQLGLQEGILERKLWLDVVGRIRNQKHEAVSGSTAVLKLLFNSIIPWPVSQLRLSPRKATGKSVLVAALKGVSAVFSVPLFLCSLELSRVPPACWSSCIFSPAYFVS